MVTGERFPHGRDGPDTRYFLARDNVDENKQVYGILKLDTSDVQHELVIKFFNDIGNINLSATELSQSEWETMQTFDLFPELYPFQTQKILNTRVHGNVRSNYQTTQNIIVTEYMVRFRDY